MGLAAMDYAVIAAYAITLLGLALWISRGAKGRERTSEDYFFASHALPWWAIGASMIAANISAEQIIGMSGSGFAIGAGIASYHWIASFTLILVGKYFLPIFLKRGIMTMPQFLEERFDGRVRVTMAVFWLGVYIFVNLTSILWLGALAITTLTGLPAIVGLIALAAFSLAYSLYGGLKAVALTDILQVAILVIGGFAIAGILMNELSGGAGVAAGFARLLEAAPEHFDMALDPSHPRYAELPGVTALIGGLWIMNISYWGFNQYIIQRALAARSIEAAQGGVILAAGLHIVLPIVTVLPGIAAVLLAPDLPAVDQAYPTMMRYAPEGVRGLVFAALIAAIVSSIGSMVNSISTIFTMDLYRRMARDTNERRLVAIGRWVGVAALAIAVAVAQPLLGQFDQAFQYIQEFTGFFTPGITVIFLLGLFWRRATANAALAAAIGSAALSLALRVTADFIPFIDRVAIVFLACLALAVAISLLERKPQPKAVNLADISFHTSWRYNLGAAAISAVLIGLYAIWW